MYKESRRACSLILNTPLRIASSSLWKRVPGYLCLSLLLAATSGFADESDNPEAVLSTTEIEQQGIDQQEIEQQQEQQKEPKSVSRPQSDAQPDSLPKQGVNPNWLDHSQRYLANSSDEMAQWLDHFFGIRRADLEAADTTLRLTIDNEWEEYDGISTDVRVRGKVFLPRIDERLSLIISDEEEDERELEDELPSERPDNHTDVGLQYNLKKEQRARLDFRLGLNSDIKLKTYMRYRYKLPWRDRLTNRFSETLYFIDGEGFGSKTSLQHDWLFTDKKLLRFANTAKFAEDIDGVEWSSHIALDQKLDRFTALSRFIWASGETRPEYLTGSYGLGVRYRKNFYRDWLFYELEPAYAWKRPEPEDERKGTWLFTLRLEVLLER